jgi:hypothetical protein
MIWKISLGLGIAIHVSADAKGEDCLSLFTIEKSGH